MDSRIVEARPNVNETVEKRKLITYTNPTLFFGTLFANTLEPKQTETDNDIANANVDSKRSLRVSQPPQSVFKKEAGFVSAPQK